MREREVKLSAGEDFRFPDLSGLSEDVVAAPRNDERLSTVYFDSDDLRLARWGAELPLPRRAGLDGEAAGRGPRRAARPRRGRLPGQPTDAAAGRAIDLVKGYLRHADLHPQARLRTFRRVSWCRTANEGW